MPRQNTGTGEMSSLQTNMRDLDANKHCKYVIWRGDHYLLMIHSKTFIYLIRHWCSCSSAIVADLLVLHYFGITSLPAFVSSSQLRFKVILRKKSYAAAWHPNVPRSPSNSKAYLDELRNGLLYSADILSGSWCGVLRLRNTWVIFNHSWSKVAVHCCGNVWWRRVFWRPPLGTHGSKQAISGLATSSAGSWAECTRHLGTAEDGWRQLVRCTPQVGYTRRYALNIAFLLSGTTFRRHSNSSRRWSLPSDATRPPSPGKFR